VRWFRWIAIPGALVGLSAGAVDQSLGDVARQQRENIAKHGQNSRKTITNDDIPSHAEDNNGKSTETGSASETRSAADLAKAGEQWKEKIKAQKEMIAAAETEIDRAKSSIHFVEVNRYVNGFEYNQQQLKRQQQVEMMQKRLDQEKKKLEDMQEAARKAGFGNTVYDP
jgi:seryl-tRNA synthetase